MTWSNTKERKSRDCVAKSSHPGFRSFSEFCLSILVLLFPLDPASLWLLIGKYLEIFKILDCIPSPCFTNTEQNWQVRNPRLLMLSGAQVQHQTRRPRHACFGSGLSCLQLWLRPKTSADMQYTGDICLVLPILLPQESRPQESQKFGFRSSSL